jgi:isocitrate dehydrogenase kinase/phosphatase
MSTRGAINLICDKNTKYIFNAYDSYYSSSCRCLGDSIIRFIKLYKNNSIKGIFKRLKPLTNYSINDKKFIFDIKNMLSHQNDYYQEVGEKFINSIQCEWYYIINVDKNKLSIYCNKFSKRNNKQCKINDFTFKQIRQRDPHDLYDLFLEKYVVLEKIHEI